MSTISHISCAVNAVTGRERELARIASAAVRKKVAVLGGGPGGMEAARTAALRGHDVVLFEKRELGGLLIEASLPDFKSDIKPLIKYYITQLKKSGVKVIMEEATSHTIVNGKFDAAVVATGAIEAPLPNIPGINKPSVLSALDVLRGAETGYNVIVIGGGVIGNEAAVLMGKQGKSITITTRQSEVAQGLTAEMKRAFFNMIAELSITVITEVQLDEVLDDGVIVSTFLSQKSAIKGNTVVIAGGFKSNLTLWNELSQIPELEVHAIGDCVEARTIYDAIHEGYRAAYIIK
jgi:NADPH-dependent 2,4-dienoyl-CoA reductase/sulfur reductase-like enzyme